MKRAALYICYYHLSEPLVQSQVIAYLRELAARGIEMHLLTFERDRLSPTETERSHSALADLGITWHRLRYHKRPSLPATLYDILMGALMALRICREHKIELVHARGQVPSAMALLVKRAMRGRFLFDMRGLLAEEYVDGGNWRAGGLKFRLTKRMERMFFREADGFIMLTNCIKEELVKNESTLRFRAPEIQVIPCCVDTNRFVIRQEERASYRREREWSERRVITYVGKFGLWYLPDEMARFFAIARQQDARWFFQALTQSDQAPIRQALERYGVSPDDYNIGFAAPDQLPLVLSASDAGISFIQACYSKRASSPTKVGEYFAAGLPVVMNSGIGDCDRMVTGNRLGVILRDFSDGEHRRAADELSGVVADESTMRRCREYAAAELSLERVGGPRYTDVYDRLFGMRRATTEAGAEAIAGALDH